MFHSHTPCKTTGFLSFSEGKEIVRYGLRLCNFHTTLYFCCLERKLLLQNRTSENYTCSFGG